MQISEETKQQLGTAEGVVQLDLKRTWIAPRIVTLGITATASGPVEFLVEDSFFGFGGNMNPDCDPTMAICTLPNTS